MRNRIVFLLLFAVTLQLPAWAYNPKNKSGINDGSGIGDGHEGEGTDVRLPIGLPFQYTDVSTGSGSSESGSNPSVQPARIVFSFDLTEEIGPASLRQTHTALQQARNMNAACVLIRINSYYGAIDAAENIKKELADYDRPVIVYVDGKAISAAGLISMSGDSVYMRKGSGIQGSASGAGSKKTKQQLNSEKNKSASAPFKNNSGNTYDPDRSCIMSSSEAVRSHVANAETNDMNEALKRAGVNDCQIVYYSPGFFEKMIDWCMKPAVSLSILAFLAFGIRMQQRSAFPGPVTFLLLATLPLFCLPLYQGGLSSGIEIGFLLFAIIAALLLHKSAKRVLRLLPVLLMLAAFTLCLSGSLKNSSPTEIGTGLLLTCLAFFTGWALLPTISKFISSRRFSLNSGKSSGLVSAS